MNRNEKKEKKKNERKRLSAQVLTNNNCVRKDIIVLVHLVCSPCVFALFSFIPISSTWQNKYAPNWKRKEIKKNEETEMIVK